MKEKSEAKSNTGDSGIRLALVPEEVLNSIIFKPDKILDLLSGKQSAGLNGFLTEKEAMAIIKKKATWFWQMRKNGRLLFKK